MRRYFFLLSVREDRIKRLHYASFGYLLYNSRQLQSKEKITDQQHENFYLSLDPVFLSDDYQEILHLD
jgi:hypothetical protein